MKTQRRRITDSSAWKETVRNYSCTIDQGRRSGNVDGDLMTRPTGQVNVLDTKQIFPLCLHLVEILQTAVTHLRVYTHRVWNPSNCNSEWTNECVKPVQLVCNDSPRIDVHFKQQRALLLLFTKFPRLGLRSKSTYLRNQNALVK